MAEVHPTAIVEDGARIGAGARIGPWCVVGPEVALGDGVELKSHVVVTGDTEIGADTVVFPFAVLGEVPQDLKYAGEKTRLRIGSRNRIREHVTMHVGTDGGGGVTRIGDGGLFMVGVHVAHDVQIGDRVILANNVGVAGHCVIADDVIVGGLAGVHQFVRIGRGAMIGGMAKITHDVIPYGLVQGPRTTLDGLNLVGLRRKGLPRDEIAAARAAYEALRAGEGGLADRARALPAGSPLVDEISAFILGQSDRQFMTPT